MGRAYGAVAAALVAVAFAGCDSAKGAATVADVVTSADAGGTDAVGADAGDASGAAVDASDAVTGDSVADAGDATGTHLPTLAELPVGQAVELEPGGKTTCSHDTKFAYFVRKGTSNKVVLDFQGGGACWNAETCAIGDALCTQTIESTENAVKDGYAHGIYDLANPKNPFKDWTFVVVPYCTCDIHWGDNQATYGTGKDAVTVQHRGAVNARAVLDWVYANYAKPETIFVTGCSAGSYGSLMWATHVMHHYPDVPVYQMGDSGAGIITANFLADSFPQWKANLALPDWIPSLANADTSKMDLGDVYHRVGEFYPNRTLSQYNTAYDENQTFYFQAMGGKDANAWHELMVAAIAKIASNTPNFRSFTAPGDQHCIVPFDEFYTYEAGGVKLVDWVTDLVNGKPVQSVSCQGADCAKKP